MIVSLDRTHQSNQIVSRIEESTQNSHLQGYLFVTSVWPPYLMSSTFSVPEVQGECNAPCTQSPSLQFKKVALPLLHWSSRIFMVSNSLRFQFQKKRNHLSQKFKKIGRIECNMNQLEYLIKMGVE